MPVRRGDRVVLSGEPRSATVRAVDEANSNEIVIVVEREDGSRDEVMLSPNQYAALSPIRTGGGGDPHAVLASLWAYWMTRAAAEIRSAALVTTSLYPYPHQDEAVYAAMLPQPILRFLLADEPGTGKTIMAGLYIREMQRASRLRRVLLAVPAHLVPKWERDLHRFFAIAPARMTAELARRPEPLHPQLDVWVVSLDLLARNRQVQQKLVFDAGPWDLVVFDEAHRLTPTAQTAFPVAGALAARCTHLLLLTATPHRGNEYLFRALLHILEPELYPWEEGDERRLGATGVRLRPSPLHFLRRMKEDLRGYDGVTRLFQPRHAHNEPVQLGTREQEAYDDAIAYCADYLDDRTGLASSIYGKRGGSSLHALAETLRRRAERLEAFATRRGPAPADVVPHLTVADYEERDDEERGDVEDMVNGASSRDLRAELAENQALRGRIRDLLGAGSFAPAKLEALRERILRVHGIGPATGEQLLIFTEFADTAHWLARLLRDDGYTVEVYAGAVPSEERDRIQQRFLGRQFQVLISTDAGNEGIDLQSAHVQVNWDIPWSIVRMEQRMGRLHRIGQTSPVHLYNLIATTTREGRVEQVVLDRIVQAANALDGKIFDSLGSVLADLGINYAALISAAAQGELTADGLGDAPGGQDLRAASERLAAVDRMLATRPNAQAAGARLTADALEAVNPVIVRAAIDAFARERGWTVHEPHAGILQVETRVGDPLPPYLSTGQRATMALSGAALAEARRQGASLRGALVAGPAEAPFRSLVLDIAARGSDALYAGAVLEDQGALTPYELQVYDCAVTTSSAGSEHVDAHPILLRLDGAGARVIGWPAVANLRVPDGPRSEPFDPARLRQGEIAAEEHLSSHVVALREQAERRLQSTRIEVDDLETRIVVGLSDLPTPERRARTARVRAAFTARRDMLACAVDIRARGPTYAGRVLVLPGRPAGGATDQARIERQAMDACYEELTRDYQVDDVHQDGVGYDLRATRRCDPRDVRCVEVKGKGADLEDGIFLEASEWLQAGQLGAMYWVYLVVNCATAPEIFGRYRDPAYLFQHSDRLIQRHLIPASALRRAVVPG